MPATHIGTICISNNLFLQNVLCVPSFSINLLSFSKLTQTSNICMSFYRIYCILQDQLKKMMIGIAFEKHGLYHFVSSRTHHNSTSINFSTIQKYFDIWHYRLGHVPSS